MKNEVKANQIILQFKITLLGIKPQIWRRIQVPVGYSFWDLHVALQDAMGWLDYHLHAFRFHQSARDQIQIGMPDQFGDLAILPGWEVALTDYFKDPGDVALYEYDFGDGWDHELLLEGILIKEKRLKYPRCIDGERACPPEDCGGVGGYYNLLEILENPEDEEYKAMVEWLKGHLKNYHPYKPDQFDPKKVKFDDPKMRWEHAFSESEN